MVLAIALKEAFLMKTKVKFTSNIKIIPIRETLINIDNKHDIDFLNYLLKTKQVSINQ